MPPRPGHMTFEVQDERLLKTSTLGRNAKGNKDDSLLQTHSHTHIWITKPNHYHHLVKQTYFTIFITYREVATTGGNSGGGNNSSALAAATVIVVLFTSWHLQSAAIMLTKCCCYVFHNCVHSVSSAVLYSASVPHSTCNMPHNLDVQC